MRREDLEHLIRAAGAITNEYEFTVVGSQSILGTFPHPPEELVYSDEADLYPTNRPDLSDLVDGSIGEGSPFHETFKFYAQGVGPETATLPSGWADRLCRLQTAGTDQRIAWCLDPTDMAASKLVAGREKDWPFVTAMLRFGLIHDAVLRERIRQLPISEERRVRLGAWVSKTQSILASPGFGV